MTIANPTPHEVEALRVAEQLRSCGSIVEAAILDARVNRQGINDDSELRVTLAFVARSHEQIGESIRRVHAAIDAASAGPEAA